MDDKKFLDENRVSVIIPAFNAEVTIKQAIDAVLRQTRPVSEVIVVDDGSVDGTSALIKAQAALDQRVRYIGQMNGGVSAARNRGILAAQGTHVAFLDSDDYWEPDHIEKTLVSDLPKLLQASPILGKHIELGQTFDSFTYVERVIKSGWGYHISNLIVPIELARKELFREGYTTGEDHDFVLRLLWRLGAELRIGMQVTTVVDQQGTAQKPSRFERLSWSALDKPNAIVVFCDEEISLQPSKKVQRLLLTMRRRTEMSVLKSLAAQRRFGELEIAAKRLRAESKSFSLSIICAALSLFLTFFNRRYLR